MWMAIGILFESKEFLILGIDFVIFILFLFGF